jgi:hypothetical protein
MTMIPNDIKADIARAVRTLHFEFGHGPIRQPVAQNPEALVVILKT